jgi:aspartyl-tRNA(Asn)/glutamyl-tRNA(Gln) amidotransferase subunit A
MLGKLNCDEFAMGSSTENSGFFVTRNPWDLERVPGGSSGGSAATVAAGGAPWAWGTDTGGSVRQPASLCGIVGVKPTYGLVSRYGLIAFASSLDQAGPFARSVEDAAALLLIAAGHDECDSTSIPRPVPDYLTEIDAGIDGMRIGVVREFQEAEGTQPGVRTRVEEAYRRLEKLGATLEEVSLPSFDYGISAYYLVAPAEASANLARYDGVRYGLRSKAGDDIIAMTSRTRDEGFGDEVKRRIMLGTYALSAGYYEAYYGKAQKVRTLIIQDLERAYERVDLIVCPTSPTTAFKLGERVDDPLAMYLSDVFTVPVNMAGNAAISVPCGLSPDDGLPVGLQIIAKALDEATMFRAAFAFEQDLGFAERPPL